MRLILCCGRFPAISETFVNAEVRGLAERGHQVSLLAEMPGDVSGPLDGEPPRILARAYLGRGGGSPLGGLSSRLSLMARALGGLPGLVRRASRPERYLAAGLRWQGILAAEAYRRSGNMPRADLVHAHFGPNALWARGAALRQGIPLFVTFHGFDASSYPASYGWKVYGPLLDPPAATFIAHSPWVAARLRSALGIRPFRIPLGVDTGLFRPVRSGDRSESPAPRLVFVGRLIAQKGARVALETLALLRSSWGGLPTTVLDLVGEGEEKERLVFLARLLGVESAVRFHGNLPRAGVAALLGFADFALVPSLRDRNGAEEAFGLVALEAQACGTLVIASDCGGLPAAVGPPVGGRCVPEHSPAGMASAVRELWRETDLRIPREEARRRILSEYSLEGHLTSYERLFRWVLAGGKGGAPVPDFASFPGRPDELPREEAGPAVAGSIPAYVCGRRVLELRRGAASRSARAGRFAAEWSCSSTEVGEVASRMEKHPDLVLDLDGADAAGLRLWEEIAARALPGTLGLVAVRDSRKVAASAGRVLQAWHLAVQELDPLFVPTDPASPGREWVHFLVRRV